MKTKECTVVVIGTNHFVNLAPIHGDYRDTAVDISLAEDFWNRMWVHTLRKEENPFGSVRKYAQRRDYMCCAFVLVEIPSNESNGSKPVTMLAHVERHNVQNMNDYTKIKSGDIPVEGKKYYSYHNHMGDTKIYNLITFYNMENVCGDVITRIKYNNQTLAANAVISFNLFLDNLFFGFKTKHYGIQPLTGATEYLCFEKKPDTNPLLYVEHIFDIGQLGYNKKCLFAIYNDGTVMACNEVHHYPGLERCCNYLIQLYGAQGTPLIGDRHYGIMENINRYENTRRT